MHNYRQKSTMHCSIIHSTCQKTLLASEKRAASMMVSYTDKYVCSKYFHYAIIRLFLSYFDNFYNPNCHKIWTNLRFNISFTFMWIVFPDILGSNTIASQCKN